MTLRSAVLACALGVLAVLFGCRGETDGRRTVTLWHAYSGDERAALEELAAVWNAEHDDVALRLVNVPYDAFSDKITAAIPNGNGPDLFIFAHDRIGDWAAAGVLEPVEFFVDESLVDRFDHGAVSAMAYRDSLFGLPLAMKSLALFYRTDLVAQPPRTTDELIALGRVLTDRDAGRFGLAYENTKLYGHALWLHGFGARIFDDQGELAIGSPEAVRALAFARELGGPDGIVPAEVTGQLAATLFQEGKAAMVISGPWFMGGLADGVPWAVTTLPILSATGRPAAPFLGVEGVMMSTRARDKRAAFAIMEFLTSDASALARALRARQVVPNQAAHLDPRIAGDAALSAFRAQAIVAVPMPSQPAMRSVWTPYDTAIQRVIAQGADPATALADAEREIRGYLESAR